MEPVATYMPETAATRTLNSRIKHNWKFSVIAGICGGLLLFLWTSSHIEALIVAILVAIFLMVLPDPNDRLQRFLRLQKFVIYSDHIKVPYLGISRRFYIQDLNKPLLEGERLRFTYRGKEQVIPLRVLSNEQRLDFVKKVKEVCSSNKRLQSDAAQPRA